MVNLWQIGVSWMADEKMERTTDEQPADALQLPENEQNQQTAKEKKPFLGFVGSYNHGVDGKGRMIIPASFREALGDQFAVCPTPDFKAVAIYTLDGWVKRREELEALVKLDAYGQLTEEKQQAVFLAALLHDVGKVPTFTRDSTGRGHFYGHAQVGAKMADEILHRLKAPTALRERAVFLIDKHMLPLTPEKKLLRRRLAQYGWEGIEDLLILQRADFLNKGVRGQDRGFDAIREVLDQIRSENACLSLKDLAVNGHDLMALGIRGRAVGETLNRLLEAVIEEEVPNEKQALLQHLQ